MTVLVLVQPQFKTAITCKSFDLSIPKNKQFILCTSYAYFHLNLEVQLQTPPPVHHNF